LPFGLGGLGGGGAGASPIVTPCRPVAVPAGNGVGYTGGGGGGGGNLAVPNYYVGGNGGKGVVMVSYLSCWQLGCGGAVYSAPLQCGVGRRWTHIFTASGAFIA
jgi:hypothetical protein